MLSESQPNKDAEISRDDDKLEDVAETERVYLKRRLLKDLGREPTEEEVDEWLRQHTEGY